MSGEEVLSKTVLSFLDSYIDSIEQLRVLLLLHADPDRLWTPLEITNELRSADSAIEKRLHDLHSRGVLKQSPELKGKYRFTVADDSLLAAIDELAHEHSLRPYRIIDAIYSRPKTGAALAFAAAFKLRGGKP